MEAAHRIGLEDIGESYGKYRIPDPAGEHRIYESMRELGQLSPVVVGETEDGRKKLLDGFKRLHAARKLSGMSALFAYVSSVRGYAQKAMILKLNWKGGHLLALEEASVVQSLHREDKLDQVAIARLLGRHPSWVCRRLSLVEQLHEEVKSHIALGLVPVSFGRELGKLPRGNQEEVLQCLVKHSFCRRETEILVRHLLQRPRTEWQCVLFSPWELINRAGARPRALEKTGGAPGLHAKLSALDALAGEVVRLLERGNWCAEEDLHRLRSVIRCLQAGIDAADKRQREQPCPPF